MPDRFLQISGNPNARRIVQSLGLPVPLPQVLERDPGPWKDRSLQGRDVVVGIGSGGQLGPALAGIIAKAGAAPQLVGGDPTPFVEAGEAWGRPPVVSDDVAEGKSYALIFDATGLSHPDQLRELYDFFHPRMSKIDRCGRMIVLARPVSEAEGVAQTAAQRAIEGFTRSAAKELGRKGATANLISVSAGAEERLAGTLRWFASPRSAYVSGQHLEVSSVVADSKVSFERPLAGKTAVVTGAARGIGAATARALAREGAHVVVLDRPADDALASQVADEVGGSVLLQDVTDPDAPQAIHDFLKERFGGVDIVIHNAGITRDKTLGRMKPEWWDLTLNVNLSAILRINEAIDPILNEGARLVSLASIAGIAGNVGQTNYGASKAGVIGMVKAHAEALASRGIAVNAVAPGFIETRLTDAIPVATREVGRRLCNLSQGGLPADVAEALTFLSSPGALGLSGQVLRVCGGNLLGR